MHKLIRRIEGKRKINADRYIDGWMEKERQRKREKQMQIDRWKMEGGRDGEDGKKRVVVERERGDRKTEPCCKYCNSKIKSYLNKKLSVI